MISSTSSSSRALAAVALAAALAGGPARGDEARAVTRVALLPIENVSGVAVPVRRLLATFESALARQGIEVVTGAAVDAFLERHRIRYTGAVDPLAASTAADELAVDGIVATVLEQYTPGDPPRIALSMRLVSTGPEPTILWMDGFGRAGDESPGLFKLGLVHEVERLEEQAAAGLSRSLARALSGAGPRAPRCGSDPTYAPKIPFRSTFLGKVRAPKVVVLPWVNHSRVRGAGEALALAAVQGLLSQERFRVVEPGVTRDLLLRYRVILQGGVNLEQARTLLGAMEADLMVAGEIFDFEDPGTPAALRLSFTLSVLDGHTGAIVWQSTSHNRGDDGETLFKQGRVFTAHEAACRMVRKAIDGMMAARPPPSR
ncbi:MAG: hypothetical protein QM704_20645 [Anaeromyxobacteraceae bacterium]